MNRATEPDHDAHVVVFEETYADAREFLDRHFEKMISEARAGTLRCPNCGALRPKLVDQPCYALYCDDCRGDDHD